MSEGVRPYLYSEAVETRVIISSIAEMGIAFFPPQDGRFLRIQKAGKDPECSGRVARPGHHAQRRKFEPLAVGWRAEK